MNTDESLLQNSTYYRRIQTLLPLLRFLLEKLVFRMWKK